MSNEITCGPEKFIPGREGARQLARALRAETPPSAPA